MSIKHEITCDNCGKDLTYTTNQEDYYLTVDLAYKRKKPGTKFVTAMAVCPPVNRAHQFCDLKCMDAWRPGYRGF